MLSKTEKRSLSWTMKFGSIEGIRVMRAYSRRDQQVKQFQKKTASL